jgi:ArsR family transcriptional regulator
LKILCVIGKDEACVQEIVDAVGTSQSNVSQHLAIMRDKGVLATRKEANRVYYRVADPRTLQLVVLMRELFCHR